MTTPVFAQIKIVGPLADKVRSECERRNISQAALLTEMALEGLSLSGNPEKDALAATERRIASTMVSLRSDVESLTATVDVLTAMVDALAKLLLVHLPEPAGDTLDGVLASALSRHEALLKSVAATGFDERRPVALRQIVRLLDERLNGEQDGTGSQDQ
jgi:hypothetical protein